MHARDLQPGSVVILEAEEWILPPLDLENVYLESPAGIRKFLSFADFIRLQHRSTQHVEDLTQIPEVRFQEAAKRLDWIRPLIQRPFKPMRNGKWYDSKEQGVRFPQEPFYCQDEPPFSTMKWSGRKVGKCFRIRVTPTVGV